MKRTTTPLLMLPLVALMIACGEGSPDASGSPHTKGGGHSASCIADYAQKPCTLFTPELVKGAFADFPSEIETAETRPTNSCQHSWAGDRIQRLQMGSFEVEVPRDNRVAISWIQRKDRENPEAWFRQVYRTLSEEEKIEAQAALDQALAKQSEGLSEEQRNLAGSLGRGLIASREYEILEGVGTVAAWDASPMAPTLKVLDGDTEFGIEVDVSDDSNTNRELAIALARAVIAACP